MTKKSPLIHGLLNFVAWITGIIVSLAVAFAMIDGPLAFPKWLGGAVLTKFAGWVVVITVVLSIILAVMDYLS